MQNIKSILFDNGDKMPMLGLGTWKSAPGDVYNAVLWAIEAGYRHIDCAAVYQNEKEVGKALTTAFQKGLVKREDIFITSKLWNNAHEEHRVEEGLKRTLKDLQLDYLDLYLIHWPVSVKSHVLFPEKREDFYSYQESPLSATWRGMEKAKQIGLVKHIGVSNFNISKLKEVMADCNIKPEMNQVELHPLLPQDDLLAFCMDNGIYITAYSPLGSTDRPENRKRAGEPRLMEYPVIRKIAVKHGVSPAQVLIAWSLNRDTAVIPKSANKERIKQNLEAANVRLDDTDMRDIADIKDRYRFIDGTFFTAIEGSPYKASDLWES